MTLPYVSPSQMAHYKQALQLFVKNAPSVECIRSHYFADRTGVCDLTGAKEQEEIFVLANKRGGTMKVSANAMQIVANVVDIVGADQWYVHLKEQRKAEKERRLLDAQKREEQKSAPRAVLFKRRPNELLEKNKNS